MAAKTLARKAPRSERPHMPGDGLPAGRKGLLAWKWAVQRLMKSRNYWIVTVRPNGAPHAMPVWGIWMDATFYFSTGGRSRKARNLAANARCIVCTGRAEDAAVLEGTARAVQDARELRRIAAPYARKYKPWKLDTGLGPVFAVRPRVVFGMSEKRFVTGATRWRF